MTSLSESDFESHVDRLKAAVDGRAQLVELLDERHPIYAQRAATAIVRMRGWILLALGELGITDRELVYVLEELDTGREPYLVAAAACALRSYEAAHPGLGICLERAQENIRFRDDALRLDRYGGYADAQPFTTAIQELEVTLRLISARPVRAPCCCGGGADIGKSVASESQVDCAPPATHFQDHAGASFEFRDFFVGHPTIVVFFYTRCANPQKCSLTMTKLGRIGVALRARGLEADIRTAAITYDPEFDNSDRLRRYAQSRSVLLDQNHRVLRPVSNLDELRNYFENGVSFVGSIVNRHRVELYILDGRGRIAASFNRVLWDENEVIEAAVRLLRAAPPKDPDPPQPPTRVQMS